MQLMLVCDNVHCSEEDYVKHITIIVREPVPHSQSIPVHPSTRIL